MTAMIGGAALICGVLSAPAWAGECGDDEDFGECRVLIEINSTDGDIGFHWLADGDDLNATRIDDPDGQKVFENGAFGPLREQKLTESFGESAEPPCWHQDGEADEDEILTLRDFRDIWEPGTYAFRGKSDEGEKTVGEAELTYFLPAAPTDLAFDELTGIISWKAGDGLGNCTPEYPDSLEQLYIDGVLGSMPADVPVIAFEVVMEPDVDDTDRRAGLVFSTRVASNELDLQAPGDMYQLTVPADYLASLGDDTPVKIEVGAIGGDFEFDEEDEVDGDADNATFTEEDGFCVNEDEGCEEDEE
jgi:hypothetical protein